jgi:DNA-binding protein HU-beta
MKKADLLNAIASATGESQATVDAVLASLADATSKALGEGDEVTLPGIVKLGIRAKPERMGRNPKTGEAIKIAAKTVVTTKVLKGLADHVA